MSQHAGLCSRPCASGGGRAEEGGRGPGQGAGEAQARACAHASGHAFGPGAHGMAHCRASVWKYDAPARWERCAPGVRAFDTLESLIPVGDSCLWLPGVAKGRARRGATCASLAPPPPSSSTGARAAHDSALVWTVRPEGRGLCIGCFGDEGPGQVSLAIRISAVHRERRPRRRGCKVASELVFCVPRGLLSGALHESIFVLPSDTRFPLNPNEHRHSDVLPASPRPLMNLTERALKGQGRAGAARSAQLGSAAGLPGAPLWSRVMPEPRDREQVAAGAGETSLLPGGISRNYE